MDNELKNVGTVLIANGKWPQARLSQYWQAVYRLLFVVRVAAQVSVLHKNSGLRLPAVLPLRLPNRLFGMLTSNI